MKYSYVYTSKIRQAFFADTLELAIFGMGLEYHIKNLWFSVEDDILAWNFKCTCMNPAVFTRHPAEELIFFGFKH